MSVKINIEDYDQVSVIAVQGELLGDDGEDLRRQAQQRLDGSTRDFVLDLSGAEFIDSQGLETLLWLQEQSGERLGQVRLVGCSPEVQTIFQVTRLAARFDCHDDVDAAIRSLR